MEKFLISFLEITSCCATLLFTGFPGGSEVKDSTSNAGDSGSIPGSGRSPGEGNGNHSSILAWRIPWTEKPGRLQSRGSQSRKRLSNFTFNLQDEGTQESNFPLLSFFICKMETGNSRVIQTVGNNVKCLPHYLEYPEVSINTIIILTFCNTWHGEHLSMLLPHSFYIA